MFLYLLLCFVLSIAINENAACVPLYSDEVFLSEKIAALIIYRNEVARIVSSPEFTWRSIPILSLPNVLGEISDFLGSNKVPDVQRSILILMMDELKETTLAHQVVHKVLMFVKFNCERSNMIDLKANLIFGPNFSDKFELTFEIYNIRTYVTRYYRSKFNARTVTKNNITQRPTRNQIEEFLRTSKLIYNMTDIASKFVPGNSSPFNFYKFKNSNDLTEMQFPLQRYIERGRLRNYRHRGKLKLTLVVTSKNMEMVRLYRHILAGIDKTDYYKLLQKPMNCVIVPEWLCGRLKRITDSMRRISKM